jgi:hypothetical protein
MSVSITLVGLDDLIQHLNAAGQAISSAGIRLHADAPYAEFVEKGTSRMSARPYLEPAAAQTADQIAALVAEGIVEVIETGDTTALRRNLQTGAQLLETRAQALVHVVTGYLRSSIHGEVI